MCLWRAGETLIEQKTKHPKIKEAQEERNKTNMKISTDLVITDQLYTKEMFNLVINDFV